MTQECEKTLTTANVPHAYTFVSASTRQEGARIRATETKKWLKLKPKYFGDIDIWNQIVKYTHSNCKMNKKCRILHICYISVKSLLRNVMYLTPAFNLNSNPCKKELVN